MNHPYDEHVPTADARSTVPVDARGLTKRYPAGKTFKTVLEGVDLSIAAGESVALLGRSGSGKSTLLNLLAGIDRPDGGELTLLGRPLQRLAERDRTLLRRRHLGFIYQAFNLIPTLTAAENVGLPLELNGWRRDAIARRVEDLLAELGLDQAGDAFPDRLSGGEQQRVAIARALAHDPALVLADEPTGNLDSVTGGHVLELLLTRARRGGQALLVVTHSLAVARQADRMVVLEDGRLTAGGAELAW
ncbi:MAG: ABC transporter ATP-binding protein [Gammaproteobacteria bacterium]|nr:ABC transporter ATP-binding protein [Gammaproteobacteria bacterium]